MKFFVALTLLLTATRVFAYADHCSEVRSPGYVQSICRGGNIPSDRTRNFSNQRLECTSNSDNFFRRPQKFDFNAWSTDALSGNAQLEQKAFDERRKLPLIQWSGTIPYETVEHWNWQACELHQSAAECGTHEECHNTTENECDHDKDGKEINCHDVDKRVCEDVANTCYYDVTYSEALHCSDEIMNYKAQFIRPTAAEWNLQKDGKVATTLPNKYDLLPGELENVQTYNNAGSSTVLRPNTDVVNHWNKYSMSYSGSGVGAQCLQDRTYDLSVAISTDGRIFGKKGPNAFRLPVDMEGHPTDVFGDSWAIDAKTGKKLRPERLLLADSSAAMIQSISEISRKSTAREVQKIATGRGQNKDASKLSDQGFLKNTVVKIQLFKINKMWFDKHASWDVKTSDVKAVRASNNVLSKDQDIANSDSYQFNLDSVDNFKENIYKRTIQGLVPDRVYEFRISMYQKGVPFYNQSCADNSKRLKCLGIGWSPFNTEGQYFSDPIKVRFETPKVEQRNFMQRYDTFMDVNTLGPIGWIAEKIGHERTTGANK
jgi:hypothetical protein